MRRLADVVMTNRSRELIARICPYLPKIGFIADVGSGTGHNAEEIRHLGNLTVREFDVADLHWVGPGPEIIVGTRLPVADDAFDGLLLAFVLQYVACPEELLQECLRVTHGRILILQSTYRGWWGRIVLTIREFFWGRLALWLALRFGLVKHSESSLRPCYYFTRPELKELFTTVGLEVVEMVPAEWLGMYVSRDLFVLESKQR